jgi:long-chain acyl-CoA synthetase
VIRVARSLTPVPETVAGVLDATLAVDPGRTAVDGPSGSLTYEALDAGADAAAALFMELGVKPGDRVAATLPNDLDIVVAFHGAMRLGAIWLGINRPLAVPEKAALLDAAQPVLVVADAASAEVLEDTGTRARILAVDRAQPDDAWRAGLRSHANSGRHERADANAPAAIAFTSGTTGLPVGIVHSQRGLMLPAQSLALSRGYGASFRKGDCLPLTILNVVVLSTLLASAAGGTCVLTDRRDAYGVAHWLEEKGVTAWNAVPALLHSMVSDESIGRDCLRSITDLWTGGAHCSEELITAFVDKFGIPVRATYGLTEAPSIVAIDPMVGAHVPDASGQPLPHLEIIVRDDDGGQLEHGLEGEICVRAVDGADGHSAYRPMLGYWREGAVESYDCPELRTGDLGCVDAGGNVVIRDRKKLLIIRGGANIYPAEVERVLCEVPGVRTAAVLGLPDARLGQRIVAVVEADPDDGLTQDLVVEHCQTRLAPYKVPERVVVVIELQRNSMGKVQRAALGALFGPDG